MKPLRAAEMSSGSSLPPDSIASPLPPARTIAAWRLLLRAGGVLLALFTVCFWAAKGYHRGWTKNQVRIDQVDRHDERIALTLP